MASKKAKPAKRANKETKAKDSTKPAKEAPATNGAAALEQEVLKETGEKGQSKDEDFNEYAQRLAEAIDAKDSIWEALSEPAQAWFAATVEALKNEKDCPAFKAFAAKSDAKASKNEEAEDEPAPKKKGKEKAEKPAKTEKTSKVAKAAKAEKPAKAAKAPKEKKERSESDSHKILVMVCESPTLSADEIVVKAKKGGVGVAESHVRNMHRRVQRVLKALKEVGKLK